MPNKKVLAGIALILFAGASVIKMYCSLAQQTGLNYASTAALMPMLAVFYMLRARKIDWLIPLGLIGSLVGDLFMLSSSNQGLLMLGMGAFFLSHVFFILALTRPIGHFTSVKPWQYCLAVPYILYGVLVFFLLRPHLGELRIPAIIYMAAVLLRGYAALTRVGTFKGYAYWLPLTGSLLFILSDTIIAFNVFAFGGQMRYGDFFAVLSYVPAQVLLVLGFLP